MKAFIQLVIANAREFSRDITTLFWFVAFPVIFILIFGAIFSNPGNSTVELGLVQEDDGPYAMGVAKALEAVPVFAVSTGERQVEMDALQAGQRRAVVVIPEGMSNALAAGQKVSLPVYYDATQQAGRELVLSVMSDVAAELDRHITARPQLVGIQPEAIQAGHKLRDIDYLLPGILSMALMQLGLFGTMRFVSMRERKVFKRLGATPLPKITMLAAEIVVRLIMALIQTLLIVAIGQLVFGVKMIGSWPALFGLVLLGAATFVSMGYMVAAFAHTEDAAQSITQAIQFPMMFLGGVFFPVDMMPQFLKPVIKIIPLNYLGDLLRQVMVGAAAQQSIPIDLAVLGGTTLLTLWIAVRYFRWE